ncbi:adenylate/guanylate cyclase domain-containing response regulator [Phyllobacterium brassicacearum]|uniref:Adenylate/guanylate cyclase domain-containing response regulator n=1 Tax=Phyllobacterium brassicacearum TaxID=314235 RepID=A0A2P7AYE7_9HYPH|nr:adenylate/guanylate cyclase domain-containing protein [Phyllobacterium brassicacearum]PSH59232.1 adenylate/guanylate cyclase domain-containing response regulator [Phyllobacterium brassicacearum]
MKREGYGRVACASNGREALELLATRPFDLVLLDITMPEMDGYQVLAHLKADTTLRNIPVVMISAVDEIDSVARCIALGAEDYLAKPFNTVLLRARVAACLEKKRLHDQEAVYTQQIENEKRRADELLYAMLPPGAVRELKANNEVRPRRYNEVAVLFCDIVGFTTYCDENPPEKVVEELQALVGEYERIVRQHEMEKIKTIGDAFMATAGLFDRVPDPVFASLQCGLDMVTASRHIEPKWEVRVGVQFGPVVAGIIGQRQYVFDLWGDTVNVASRIAAYASPGTVATSGATWHRIRERGRGHSLGFVEIKGKGQIELIECQGLR